MICPDCNGTGWIKFGYEDHWHDVPCMECGGTGIRHCCEGERPGNVKEDDMLPVAICVRMDDLASPRVQSTIGQCGICGKAIWIADSTPKAVRDYQCTHCVAKEVVKQEKVEIVPPTPRQLEDIKHAKGKPWKH